MTCANDLRKGCYMQKPKAAFVGAALVAAALATAPARATPTGYLGARLQVLITETQRVAEVVPAPTVPPPASYAPAPAYVLPPPPVVYYVPRPPPPPLVWYRPYWSSRPYWGWRRWWW
jgi:hypothetical protein